MIYDVLHMNLSLQGPQSTQGDAAASTPASIQGQPSIYVEAVLLWVGLASFHSQPCRESVKDQYYYFRGRRSSVASGLTPLHSTLSLHGYAADGCSQSRMWYWQLCSALWSL